MHSEDSRPTIAIDACRKGFVAIGVFSLFINLLMLTAPLYMLQLFDRILTSRSTDTLIVLMLIAGVALLVMTILEIVRGAMLVRLGTWLEWQLAGDVLNADVFANLKDSAQRSDQGSFLSQQKTDSSLEPQVTARPQCRRKVMFLADHYLADLIKLHNFEMSTILPIFYKIQKDSLVILLFIENVNHKSDKFQRIVENFNNTARKSSIDSASVTGAHRILG